MPNRHRSGGAGFGLCWWYGFDGGADFAHHHPEQLCLAAAAQIARVTENEVPCSSLGMPSHGS